MISTAYAKAPAVRRSARAKAEDTKTTKNIH
jgi:hypothetical protein